MKILYEKSLGTTMMFSPNETNVVLKILRALYGATRYLFIKEAMNDIEASLRPKLPYDARFHLCEVCCMEIDIRKDSYVNIGGTFRHQSCPILKERSS
jgi:hypothetical protein